MLVTWLKFAVAIGRRGGPCLLMEESILKMLLEIIGAFGIFLVVMFLDAICIVMSLILQAKSVLNFMKFLKVYPARKIRNSITLQE
jgi:hypothetical protein